MAASAAVDSGTGSQTGPDSHGSTDLTDSGFGRTIQEMKETQPAPGGLRLLFFIGTGIGLAMAVMLRIVLIARQLPADLPIDWACPVLSSTGLLCMGCGATRALRSLLDGDLMTAMRQNLLFVALLAGLPMRLLPLRRFRMPMRLLPLRRFRMPMRLLPLRRFRMPMRLLPLRRFRMPMRLLPLYTRFPVLRQPRRLAGWILLAIAIAFMIVRNLDGPLPALLRP